MQQPSDVVDVVLHCKSPLDQLGYARTGPQVHPEARGHRPLEPQPPGLALVLCKELGRSAGSGASPQSLCAILVDRRLPAANAPSIDSDTLGYLPGPPPFPKQRQSAQASTFKFPWGSGRSQRAPPTGSIGHSFCRGTRPGNAAFVPPPAGEVLECMSRLERFLNDLPEPTPELLKVALAHVQFETIHPFLDGNGRAGLTRTERVRLKVLERENRELERANESLRKASLRGGIQRVWEENFQACGPTQAALRGLEQRVHPGSGTP